MNIICFLSLFLVSVVSFAQSSISIVCPANVTVFFFDLDLDYMSYGEPTVLSQDPYNLEKVINKFNYVCKQNYATIKYTAVTGSGNTKSCEQRIEITLPTLDDISFPQDIELSGIYIDEAVPDLTGHPEPWIYLQIYDDIYIQYSDIRINPSSQDKPAKILRKWSALNWCTGDFKNHTQLIKIFDAMGLGSGTTLDFETCAGEMVNVLDLSITTDEVGFQVITDNCELIGSNLLDYVNCVADNNAIETNSKFILELEGPKDYLNGVSTLDMIFIQRHILAINSLQEFCNLQASDVNLDGRISAFDLLLMRQLILGQTLSFPTGASWVFYNALAQDVSLPAEQRDLKFTKAEFPLSQLDIIAVKLGDVNGSAQ